VSLSNTKIRKYIESKEIYIGKNSSEEIPVAELDFDTTALNLHLANEFVVWKEFKSGAKISVDPGNEKFNFKNYAHDFTDSAIKDREGYYKKFSSTNLSFVKHQNIFGSPKK